MSVSGFMRGASPAGRGPDSLPYFHVARATTDISRKRVIYLCVGRPGMRRQKVDGRHDEPRCAIAALDGSLPDERLLDGVERAPVRKALDRRDFFSLRAGGKEKAGVDGFSINEDGTGTALSFQAILLCAREVEVISQHVQQGGGGIDVQRMSMTVDPEVNCHQ
jgi:hypothetical protein